MLYGKQRSKVLIMKFFYQIIIIDSIKSPHETLFFSKKTIIIIRGYIDFINKLSFFLLLLLFFFSITSNEKFFLYIYQCDYFLVTAKHRFFIA